MTDQPEEKAIAAAASGGVVIGQLDELAMGSGSDVPVILDTVGKTLAIIEEHFYLVPKVEVNEAGDVVARASVEGAIELSLAAHWNEVNG